MSSNYEKMLSDGARIFSSKDRSIQVKRFEIPLDEDYLYPVFLGEEYRISRNNGYCEMFVQDENKYIPANFHAAMTLYDLICFSSDPIILSGNYTFFINLTKMQSGTSFAGKGILEDMGAIFDQKSDTELREAMIKIGGHDWGKGDVSCEIPVFSSLNAAVSFWHSDEDFPPSLKVYTDDRILNYMHYETVWYMVAFVLDKIKDAMS